MPGAARKEIVDESQVGVYHCISRCVRRAFLCGGDAASGKSFEHRRGWIQDRLEFLAGIFAVDILGFAVLSNHMHLLLRIRPDVAEGWSDEDVARRWWRLHPRRRNEDGSPAEPEAHELRMLMADPQALARLRRRLASLSWFMRSLTEPIARRANHEDRMTGHFWEGRFRSQAVLDEAALLACSIYIDLNPIRARLAETPETSQFTAAFERIAARGQAADAEISAPPDVTAGAEGLVLRDGWLSPVPDADAVPRVAVVRPPDSNLQLARPAPGAAARWLVFTPSAGLWHAAFWSARLAAMLKLARHELLRHN